MKFSIVIEWENALLSEVARTRKMVQVLQEQILNLRNEEFEVFVLFNPEQVDRQFIESILAIDISDDFNSICKVISAKGMHYFELKNLGAKIATGDVVIFLDSDIVPEERWLDCLIDVFYKMDHANVLHSSYYIDPVDFVNKAFAINWFFPLRSESNALVEVDSFFANSVAFKRQFFLERTFPSLSDGRTRGACKMLSKQIRDEGFPIYKVNAAKVSHPAPSGLKNFFIRALAQGRDSALKRKFKYNFLMNSLRTWFGASKKIIIRVPFNTLRDFSKVNLSIWQVPFAIVMMMVFFFVVGLGAQMALIFPKWMSKNIRI